MLRGLGAIALTLGVFAAAFSAGWALRFFYAAPSAAEYLDYLAHSGVSAKLIAPGALHVDGMPFRCRNRPIILDASLDDYGASYYGYLIINPARFKSLPGVLRHYAFAHECGHQFIGRGELSADCFSIRSGVSEGWLDGAGLERICAFIGQSKGDGTHPPGRERCAYMRACFNEARGG